MRATCVARAMIVRAAIALLALVWIPGFAPPAAAADEAPPWLKQLASITPAKYDGKVKTLVLFDESRLNVEEGGKITTTNLHALRILTKEGRREAHGQVIYQTGTGKVKELRAWLIRPSGEVKKYGKDRVVDLAMSPNDVFNDVRMQTISGVDDADPGSVFGYESVEEDKSVFTQFEWLFQGVSPSLLSRFVVTVPNGWRADGVVFNHAKSEPQVSGNSYTWELRDMAPVEREPSGPQLTSVVPWLAVSLAPAAGARTGLGKAFENWQDVSRWLAELADSQIAPSAELTAKTQALTKDAKSDWERIQAIGRYAQNVKYVSIQTGVGRGGGYKPHSAAEVFAKSYGDCKDKANLMRAMLKVAGIESYPLSIYSGDRARVRAEWASPQQFNHAIIAIKVKDDVKADAIGTFDKLGRLLIFDPTDEHTPLGLIPEDEEGSLALLVSADGGALLRMPTSAPEANRIERHVELTLAADGTITGKLEEKSTGHPAADARHEYSHMDRSDYRKVTEAWISEAGAGATVDSLEVTEPPDESVNLSLGFKVPRYARLMQGTLLIIKPAVIAPRNRVYLAEQKRQYPVVLNSESFEETMRMKLPEGFEVDELPASAIKKTAFGSFIATCQVKDGYLIFHRTIVVNAGTVPVAEYKEARDFFGVAYGAGVQPLVLAKK